MKRIKYNGEYIHVSKGIAAAISKSNRKMRYQEVDIKREHTLIDLESKTVQVIPSKEDSYDRLFKRSFDIGKGTAPQTDSDIAIFRRFFKHVVI